eukprot:13262066-Alexandrium_andersonii.AAC.1
MGDPAGSSGAPDEARAVPAWATARGPKPSNETAHDAWASACQASVADGFCVSETPSSATSSDDSEEPLGCTDVAITDQQEVADHIFRQHRQRKRNRRRFAKKPFRRRR